MKRLKTTLMLAMACSFPICLAGNASPRDVAQTAQNIAMAADNTVEETLQPPGGSSSSKAPGFELEDQYGRTHFYRFPRERVSLLAFGDRTGSEQIEGWIRPLYKRYGRRIDIFGVADVSAAPRFLRGIIRRAFRSKLDYPVMLDWNGTVSKSYGYHSGEANIFLVDKQGHIVLTKLGMANAPELDHLYRVLDALLQEG